MTSPGSPLLIGGLWFLCWNVEDVELFVSSCYYFEDMLNASGWYLQPDGKARVQRP